tara:strand:- start:52 stop:171 length:120 start_codon:yes stop_codon:yes gene_type:complete
MTGELLKQFDGRSGTGMTRKASKTKFKQRSFSVRHIRVQ